MPAFLPTLSALFSLGHPFGARNLAIVMVLIFLAALGLTMWVGRLRRRRRFSR